MKHICLLLLLLSNLTPLANAQTPALLWQKALGGRAWDEARSVIATPDGGYVVAGYTFSNDEDVSGNHSDDRDYWIVKLDGAGKISWQKALGSSSADFAYAVAATSDGGYVVVGYTYFNDGVSSDGDVTVNYGIYDYWIVKLDGAGKLLWQKTLGGSGSDVARAVGTTSDGGILVAGYTNSTNGDVTGNHGSSDYWVVKLDGAGKLLWQKTLGGSNEDVATAITATSDGGYVVAGYTSSTNGDVTGNHGSSDYWVVKLDGSGKLLWQKALGGPSSEFAYAVAATADGGYVVAGYTNSTNGDVTGNHGSSDYWVVKLDGSGKLLWQKTLGGRMYDEAYAITATLDGGLVVAGTTTSTDGDVSNVHGGNEAWVVKLGTPGPTLVGLSASPNAVCAGQPVSFTATVGNLTSRYSYTLTNGTAPTSGTSTNTTFSQRVTAGGTGPQTYTLTLTNNGQTTTATASVLVNALPTPAITSLSSSYCRDTGPPSLSGSPSGGVFTVDGGPTTSFNPASLSVGQHTVVYSFTNSSGCANTATQAVTVNEVPTPPTLVTASRSSYPAGVSSLTVNQNVDDVMLTVSGCPDGTISWGGGSATTLTISTASTGVFSYSATCSRNGCISPPAVATVTVTLTTMTSLKVLYRDAEYGQLTNNIIKPYLQLQNIGSSPIPYDEITVRYWFTPENSALPTDLSVYYAQLGAVQMQYVALAQPRQGAFGYVEYRFPGGGSLGAGANSGPIENGIQKTDGSNFNEADDYSYAANYADYLPNAHITAYRNGVLVWGQEPEVVTSQTVVSAYSAAKDGATTSQIQTRVELRNEGNVPVSVASLKLRYYFTSDNGQLATVYVDYAAIGAAKVQASVVKLAQAVGGADSYVELSFPGSSLTLTPFSSLGAIDFRIVRSDYGLFDQSNDYSYAPTYGTVAPNRHISVYLDGNLVYGTPPLNAARVGVGEPVSYLQVKVLGNPVVGAEVQVEITGAAGQPIQLQLMDMQGKAVNEQRIEPAGATERVRVPLGQSRGTLLLRVSTLDQQQSSKLVRP